MTNNPLHEFMQHNGRHTKQVDEAHRSEEDGLDIHISIHTYTYMRKYNMTAHSLSRSLEIPRPHVSVDNKSTNNVSEEDELCIHA